MLEFVMAAEAISTKQKLEKKKLKRRDNNNV